MNRRTGYAIGLGVALFAGGGTAPARAATEDVLYSFKGGGDAAFPAGVSLLHVAGTFYGTSGQGGAHGRGTVFSVRPPAVAGRPWRTQVLTSFGAGSDDGTGPNTGLVAMDGILYGTSTTGGGGTGCDGSGCGTVFALAPPATAGGAWTRSTIHTFDGPQDGQLPNAGLLALGGRLYGTTFLGAGTGCSGGQGCGAVFSLTPPAVAGGSWSEAVLYAFKGGQDGGNPEAALVAIGETLYGTTRVGGGNGCSVGANVGCGTVFSLTPPAVAGRRWTQTLIHRFKGGRDGATPYAALLDVGGTLYGTTQLGGGTGCNFGSGFTGCGTAFALAPPAAAGGAWTETVLHAFRGGQDGSHPFASLIAVSGTLYGTTFSGGGTGCTITRYYPGCGTAFALTPPAIPGDRWTETVLHAFRGGLDANHPGFGALSEVGGTLYGTTSYGGTAGAGAMFSITP